MLRPHPDYRPLRCAIWPGTDATTTRTGRTTAPATAPHAALIVGHGRHTITDPAEFDQLIAALTDLRNHLTTAIDNRRGADGRLDLEVE